MSVAWSTPRDDEPGLNGTFILTGIRIDPDGTVRATLAPLLGEPAPFALPDELQPDVINPTAVFKPRSSDD